MDIPADREKEYFSVKLKMQKPENMSASAKREWDRGTRAAFMGAKRKDNPWNAAWHRNNYAVYASAWDRGWNEFTKAKELHNDS